ncbi:MAG: ferrous iron transport protein B, partial [Planctomycetota bacterium]
MSAVQETQKAATEADEKTLALVGNPNVGKSVLFSNLTGTYVTVSNYPGTTVEVSRGRAEIGDDRYEVVDTPGMYSLLPLSEDERVARDIMLLEDPDVVLIVVDSRNLERMLGLTFQLIEAGLPVVLGLNMMDEARDRGLSIDAEALAEELGIPVVPLVATSGEGMDELRSTLQEVDEPADLAPVRYQPAQGVDIEERLGEVQDRLSADYSMSDRAMAALLLQGDEGAEEWVRENEGAAYDEVEEIAAPAREGTRQPLDYLLKVQRRRRADDICSRTVTREDSSGEPFTEKLSRVLVRPVTGIPILLAVLYFALYRFVGVFGAGTAVDFLEGVVFGEWLNPYVEGAVRGAIPWPVLQDLFVGEYGIITLGLRYAIAIILPVVTFFFLVFSLIEDVGYLPRLALLLDRAFKKIGLSGRAVIPMVLGFGCDTMATMVTRTLTSKRERLISVILLSAAVPCSAQLGVIMALLSGVPGAMAVWAVTILCVYIAIGTLASRLVP